MGKIAKIRGAIRQLIADKEDTKQVFIILEALSGNSGLRAFKRFKKTPYADKILAAKKPLVEYLKDRQWLESLPQGSLGRTYARFTEVEQISADGLTDASVEGREEEREMSAAQIKYHERQRDAHDLWHVSTGYGRDGLGELCLLAVTWRQLGNPGILVIILFGYLVSRKEAPGLGIGRAILEGFRLGRVAKGLPGADWERLLTLPLDEVRAELGIKTPTRYRSIVDATPDLQTAGYLAAE
ncbi:MAG: ubiquinone biosynthesis protein COQ4 [Alphaproteobacteria bacterium]|nr:ubiquinone biosynthesis protein COQ4 [Alphaproteobacteria bacterium]